MKVFVVDEDMPRSTARALSAAGYRSLDVRDHGLRGASDDTVFRFAQENRAVLLTGDLGFGNPLRFSAAGHHGIVIARFPNELPNDQMNRAIVEYLLQIDEKDFDGSVVVLEPGRIRIRRG